MSAGPHTHAAPFHSRVAMTLAAPSTVTVHVLLFARYAEVFGADAVTLELAAPATVADVIIRLRQAPGGAELPPRPLCAVDLMQVPDTTPVAAGDEVAVLPPLAGG
jgi:molybdopterin converting factor small subunit